LARFAQAITRTSAAVPSSSHSGDSYCSRSQEIPEPALYAASLKARYFWTLTAG
jgi:hypothetical protein